MIFSKNLYIYLFFLVIYLLSLTSNFSAAHDSIGYLNGFETGTDLLQPHHMLYHITTYSAFKFLKLLLPFIANHYLIEIINAVWGAGVILIFNLFLRKRLNINPLTAFIASCLPAFSFGIWFYSANIEVYMPSLFFLVLILYKLTTDKFNKKTLLFVIILHALAILFHQVNIILTPVILWKIWQMRKEIPLLKSIAQYSFIGGGIVLITYVIVAFGFLDFKEPGEFIYWLRGYTARDGYWYPLALKTAINATVGFGHALIGGHFVFKVSFIESYINKNFFYHNLSDEPFLVRNMSSNQALFLLILSGILLIFLALSFVRTIQSGKKLYRDKKLVIFPLIFSLLFYCCFFFFWMPENLEFWFFQVIIFWILLVAGITGSPTTFKIKNNYWLACMAILLTTINFFGSIKWLQDISNDFYYEKISTVRNQATSKDLTILKDPWITEAYLFRYTAAPYVNIPQPDSLNERQHIDSLVQKTLDGGNKIFLYTNQTVEHVIMNQGFIDSLVNAHQGHIDTLPSKIENLIIIHKN